jgi:hypothetical protein
MAKIHPRSRYGFMKVSRRVHQITCMVAIIGLEANFARKLPVFGGEKTENKRASGPLSIRLDLFFVPP